MREDEWREYRRKLPHWRAAGAVYFVTWRLNSGQAHHAPEERTEVVDCIQFFHGKRYDLFVYVVMNDHVHLLLRPHEGWQLEQVLHSCKSFLAHVLQRKFGRLGQVWQSESWDRVVRDSSEMAEKTGYILNNPLKRWPLLKEYPWVGCCPVD